MGGVVVRPWWGMLLLVVLLGGGGSWWAYEHPIVLPADVPASVAAPAVPPAGTLVLGTATLLNDDAVHVAVVLYARFPNASDVTRAILDQLPCVTRKDGIATPVGDFPCPDVPGGQAPPGTERMLALLEEPVRALADATGIPGSPHSDLQLDLDGAFLLVKLASASAQGDAALDEARIREKLEPVAAHLRKACERLPRSDPPIPDCSLAIGNFSLLAEWDARLGFHGALARPEATNVLGPLAWSATSEMALVLPEGATQALPKGALGAFDVRGVFLPTSAIAASLLAFLVSFLVDPFARLLDRLFPRLRLDPFLPVPAIGALSAGVCLYVTSRGGFAGWNAITAILLPTLLVYAAVLLVYYLSDYPGWFDYVTTAWAVGSILVPLGYLAHTLLHLPGRGLVTGLGLFYAPDLRLTLRVAFLQAILLFLALLALGMLLLVAYEALSRLNARQFLKHRMGIPLQRPPHPGELLLAQSLFERHPKGLRRKGLARGGRLYLLRRHVRREMAATPPKARLATFSILKTTPPPPGAAAVAPAPPEAARRQRRKTFRDLASRI